MSRISPPPSGITGVLATWLNEIWRHLEAQPRISIDSFDGTPNSRVSGLSGDIVINVASGSTDTRAWILGGGARNALTNQGWVAFKTHA